MIWLCILLASWVTLAVFAAIVLGRAVARADTEELGSMLDWRVSEIDDQLHGTA